MSTTATITPDGGNPHGGHDCSCQASVVVQPTPQVFDQLNNDCGYIVVKQNQGRDSSRSETDTTTNGLPMLDWNTQAKAQVYAAVSMSGPWWEALGKEPLPGSNDFAQQCGLRVKKLH